VIRRLGAGDEPVLRELAGRFKTHVPEDAAAARFLGDLRNLAFVALATGEVAGFSYGYVLDRVDGRRGAFLYELEVAADHRGRGLGRALVEAFLDAAAEAGAYKAWVQTDAENEPARKTYSAAGASVVGFDLVLGWDLPARSEAC
jgi:ribosomal protein S18 acetylase RimI-like enzyme